MVSTLNTSGIPEISPFVELNKSPEERAGSIDQVTTSPPDDVGESVDIAVLLVKIKSLGEYEMTGGIGVEYVTYSRFPLGASK